MIIAKAKKGPHLGTHTEMIRKVCDHDNMVPVVQDCRKRINDLLQQQDIVRVACVDDRGIHRSVAVAEILQAVCKKKGYNTKGPFHLEEGRWKEGEWCRTCEDCFRNEDKAALYIATAEYW